MPHYKRSETTLSKKARLALMREDMGTEKACTGNVATPRRPYTSKDHYHCPELRPDPSILPSRMVAHQLPSRVGDKLYWPDGRVTDLEGL